MHWEHWEWGALPVLHFVGPPAQAVPAVGVWLKETAVYIYMNIRDFIIISFQCLHIKFQTDLGNPDSIPGGADLCK